MKIKIVRTRMLYRKWSDEENSEHEKRVNETVAMLAAQCRSDKLRIHGIDTTVVKSDPTEFHFFSVIQYEYEQGG